MASFRVALFGYNRGAVKAALASREARIAGLETDLAAAGAERDEALAAARRAEAEGADLAAMVLEREREIRVLGERLSEAERRGERNLALLASIAARMEEVQAQARNQATRIRMKALQEAVDVGRRAEELAAAEAGAAADGAPAATPGVFEGDVRLEIGPLGDFSQLVEIEEAISRLGADEISVERFSEGRATLSMRLDEPVELLRELEARAPLEFRVRRTSGEGLILDVDDEPGPEQRAA